MKDSKTAVRSTVNVIVHGGKGLKTVSDKHKYAVTCEIGQHKHRTDVVEDLSDSPVFNKEFQFQVESMDQPLVFMVTEKHERDVLGQIIVPLSSVDDYCAADPLRVPLQPGPRSPDLVTSPGELAYSVWITTGVPSQERSLTSRTTAGLGRLRRKLNSSPAPSSASRWNDFKANRRRHSADSFFDSSLDFGDISFDDDSSPTSAVKDFVPISPDHGYVKRSSLPTVLEFYSPQILEVCPSEAPISGGTVVTVRGRDLGLNREDVVGLFICGSDVVESVQYISSERLVCTTVAWRPCVGCVAVETLSGGRASSTVQFTFMAASEPPAPRVSRSSIHSTPELPTLTNRDRRLSLGSLENVKSSSLWSDEPQKKAGNVVLRRRRSVEVSTSAAKSSEPGPLLAKIQPTTTCRDVIRPSKKLPQVEDNWRGNFDDEEASHELLFTDKEQTIMTELHAQLVSNQDHITELVEENKSLKEQYEKLHMYIDGLLLRAFDACPQILCVDLQ